MSSLSDKIDVSKLQVSALSFSHQRIAPIELISADNKSEPVPTKARHGQDSPFRKVFH
jgi:hypothetical protein